MVTSHSRAKLMFSGLLLLGTLSTVGCGGSGGGDDTINGKKICGGKDAKLCDVNQFCNFVDLSCGALLADGTPASGVCEDIVPTCAADPTQPPVCTCDGLTFVNPCWAIAAGQSVRAVGECL